MIDPNTRYPKSVFDADGKETVMFSYEQHVKFQAAGWTDSKPQEAARRGPGRPKAETVTA